jgi:hypothetical protein
MTLMKIFFQAMIKVQQGHEENLSDDEAKGIAPWKLDPESGEDTFDEPISEFKILSRLERKPTRGSLQWCLPSLRIIQP